MADISFPARVAVDRESDVDGLPILTAHVTVSEEVAGLALPSGPRGERGQRGRPHTTFEKMGEIPDVAARPPGLGLLDRGRWWHRLDDNGMDVWTGTEWKHSAGAVGPHGPVADANTITSIRTVYSENLTTAAVDFIGAGAEQQLEVTVPAGLQGPKGLPGTSGAISESPDFDTASGPSHGGVFGFSRAGGKFRAMPAPMGAGPWSWVEGDFAADQESTAAQIIAATFTIPPQPFIWRPVVQGHLSTFSANSGSQYSQAVVRMHHSQGQVVASAVGSAGVYLYMPIVSTFRDEQSTVTLSPTSTYATIPAGQSVDLLVAVERVGNGTATIGYKRARASLVVYAQPI
ncbi:hypothetical protein [Nocardia sp. NPDC058480]|uniref:hypothetical protein n=1 Tax=unclassified Nocardia TaxID=2637762 RepID=UPI003649BFB0